MRIFIRSLTLACLILAPALCAGAQASPLPHLGHRGRWITDAQGRVVIVHGVNMVFKRPPYYPAAVGFGDDDAVFLARIGLNAVRVGVIWKAVEPRPGVYDDRYLTKIAATVTTLARHRIYSLLDFHQDMYNELFQGEGTPAWAIEDDGLPAAPQHGFPGNYETMPALQHAYDNFWANRPGPPDDSCAARSGEAGCRELDDSRAAGFSEAGRRAGGSREGKQEGVGLETRYAAAWRHLAQRFAKLPSVLGYELFNEPFPGSSYLSCLGPGGCPAFDRQLTAFDRLTAAAIRTVDRHTLIFAEPNVLFDFGAPTHVGALDDPEAGFAFHDYCLAFDQPHGCASEGVGFQHALAHVARTREALLLTEFGSTPAAGDLTGMISRADRAMVPWTEWSYCPCRDPTGPTPDPLVLNPARPPAGANLGRLALATLVEPYPQLIAGTPSGWGFVRRTRTFTLRYSTRRAGTRRRFAAGSITQIATPARVYPRGYAARVRGGAILSRRRAGVLQIASCPHASTVTVTVTPGARSRGSCWVDEAPSASLTGK